MRSLRFGNGAARRLAWAASTAVAACGGAQSASSGSASPATQPTHQELALDTAARETHCAASRLAVAFVFGNPQHFIVDGCGFRAEYVEHCVYETTYEPSAHFVAVQYESASPLPYCRDVLLSHFPFPVPDPAAVRTR